MSEYTKLFERAGARFEAPSLSTEGLLRRRDRKHRNQRIAAGVVGLAVFVAASWIVTIRSAYGSSDASATLARAVASSRACLGQPLPERLRVMARASALRAFTQC